jgi:hypothetical protein
MKEQTGVILNHGIIVRDGKVDWQSLAVGTGAQASGVFSRDKGQPATMAKARGTNG